MKFLRKNEFAEYLENLESCPFDCDKCNKFRKMECLKEFEKKVDHCRFAVTTSKESNRGMTPGNPCVEGCGLNGIRFAPLSTDDVRGLAFVGDGAHRSNNVDEVRKLAPDKIKRS